VAGTPKDVFQMARISVQGREFGNWIETLFFAIAKQAGSSVLI